MKLESCKIFHLSKFKVAMHNEDHTYYIRILLAFRTAFDHIGSRIKASTGWLQEAMKSINVSLPSQQLQDILYAAAEDGKEYYAMRVTLIYKHILVHFWCKLQ